MNKVTVMLKNDNSWIIDLKKNSLEHHTANDLKNMFLNKTITDGDETILVTGITFQNIEISGVHNLIELLHESKLTDAFLNI